MIRINRSVPSIVACLLVLYACGSDDDGGNAGTGGKKDGGIDTGTGGGTGATGGTASGGTSGVGGSVTGGTSGLAGTSGFSGASGSAGTSTGGTDAGTAGAAGSAGTSSGGSSGTDGGVSALGDTCSNPFLIGSVPSLNAGDTTTAGSDYGYTACPPAVVSSAGAGSPDHVYAFTPPSAGRYLVELTTTSLDSTLYAVTDCQNVDTTCLNGVDKCGQNCTETISIAAQAAATYYLIVDGEADTAPGEAGSYSLAIKNPPTNETCGSAIPVTSVPFVHESNTIGAANDYALSPASCTDISPSYTGAGASDLVYAFTPTQSGYYAIKLKTAGFDAMLYVSTVCSGTVSSCVAGSEMVGPFGEEYVNINATAGTTYYIFVDGYSTTPSSGNGGTYQLTVELPAPAPTNDTCATATVVGSLPFTATGSTLLASSDYGFAAGTCLPANGTLGNGSNDVVYSFTPTVTGSYGFVLGGFDTLLYVVTDCANINGTTCVAGIDNCGAICSESLDLTLNAGTTYYVIVDGWDNATNITGTYQLDIVKNP